MIDRRISRFTLRRGIESDRITISPLTGELIYTTDTKRVYVGDGSAGGVVISNKTHVISSATTLVPSSAVIGDLIFNKLGSLTYMVSGTGSLDRVLFGGSSVTDNVSLTSVGITFSVNASGISSTHLHPSVLSANGALIYNSTNGIAVSSDNSTIKIANNALYVNYNTSSGLSSTSNGLYINTDSTLIFDGSGKLRVAAGAAAIPGVSAIYTDRGLISTLDSGLSTLRLSAYADQITIGFNGSNQLSVSSLSSSPIVSNSISGLHIDYSRFADRNKYPTVKFFSSSIHGETTNGLADLTFVGTDGLLRSSGLVTGGRIIGGVSTSELGDGSGNTFTGFLPRTIINLELSVGEYITKFIKAYKSIWLLTNTGRMFFNGFNGNGISGDATITNNSFVKKYTQIPLSGAFVYDFKIGCGTDKDTMSVFAVASLSAIDGIGGIITGFGPTEIYQDAKVAISWGYNGSGSLGLGVVTTPITTPRIIYNNTIPFIVGSGIDPILGGIFPNGGGIKSSACLITSGGEVWSAGSNLNKTLGVPSLATSSVNQNSFLRSYVDVGGTVYTTGSNIGTISNTPTPQPMMAEYVVGSCGDGSTASLVNAVVFCVSAGKVYSAGSSTGNQLGTGLNITNQGYFIPVTTAGVNPLTGVTSVVMTNPITNGASVFATTSAGLYGWGSNKSGELGQGNITSSKFPIQITLSGASLSASAIKKIEAYGERTNSKVTLLTHTGIIYACGYINDGYGSNNTTKTILTKAPMPTGSIWYDFRTYGESNAAYEGRVGADTHSFFAVSENGRIAGWGSNNLGQISHRYDKSVQFPIYLGMGEFD